MSIILLPISIGKVVRENINKYRWKNKIPIPEEVKKWSPAAEMQKFLQEELEYVTELETDAEIMEYVQKFPNLKKISFKNGKSITMKDIEKLAETHPDLTDLCIEEQDKLRRVDVSKFSKLAKLSIKSNPELIRVLGLNKGEGLYEFEFYNNPACKNSRQICEEILLSVRKNGTKCNLDVLYYPELRDLVSDYKEIENFPLTWSERIDHQPDNPFLDLKENKCTYASAQMEMVDKKAEEIIVNYIEKSDSNKQKFAILYEWMKANVKYNYEALEDSKRMEYQKYKRNDNGMVAAFMDKKCVCEGYSKSMQYLLKKVGIVSEAVSCNVGQRRENEENNMRMQLGLKEGADHSILRTNLEGINYYNDITWDAGRFQRNDPNSYKYFLLSREEMEADRDILEEEIENSSTPMPMEEKKVLVDFARTRVQRGKDKSNLHTQRFGRESLNQQKNTQRMDDVERTMNLQKQNIKEEQQK